MEENKIIAELQDFENRGYTIYNNGTVLGKKGTILKLSVGGCGYMQVNASNFGKQKTFLIHRLVALRYIPNPDNLPEVNHLDGDKLNNNDTNLGWCTRPQNIRHGYDTGLITPAWKGKFGKDHFRSKPISQFDLSGVKISDFESIASAARVTGFNAKTIGDALRGRHKTSCGFIWKFQSKLSTGTIKL